ncbi:N-acetyltransferase domain-containing protein [Haematococcus lacustris]|uniref:N-acetyltransferase domain-containing protein n=1 Tax=Haematococcus lacustris TaxID=44745 RepID=A0A699Z8V5_HAELA|nr:N-acetyltransferase domain-containing protein [Haematococcus lacustris]
MICIRRCTDRDSDVHALHALERRVFGKQAWEAVDIRKELAKRSTIAFAAYAQTDELPAAAESSIPPAHTSTVIPQPRQQQKSNTRTTAKLGPGHAAGQASSTVSNVHQRGTTQHRPGQGEGSQQGCDSVLAYILASATSLNVHISRLCVRQEHRRQGLGRQLLLAVLGAAVAERRCVSASLHVAADNAAALGLYLATGFQVVGHLLDYYRPGSHACKLMLPFSSQAQPQNPAARHSSRGRKNRPQAGTLQQVLSPSKGIRKPLHTTSAVSC